MAIRAVSSVGNALPVASSATAAAAELHARAALGRKLDARDPAVVRQAGEQLVAELFFVPLLSEMRRFPFGRELATGGQTEAAFGQQLDQRVADVVAGASGGLVGSITCGLRPRSGMDEVQA